MLRSLRWKIELIKNNNSQLAASAGIHSRICQRTDGLKILLFLHNYANILQFVNE
jgi:hypothetical protein